MTCGLKTLMERLCPDKEQDPLKRGIYTYRLFLSKFYHSGASLSSLSMLDDRNLRTFYKADEPHLEPNFLSIKNRSDLAKLSSACETDFVIFFSPNKKPPKKSKPLLKYFDSRSTLAYDNQKTIFFTLFRLFSLTPSGSKLGYTDVIEQVEASEARALGYSNLATETHLRRDDAEPQFDRNNMVKAFAAAAGLRLPEDFEPTEAIATPLELALYLTSGEDAAPVWKAAGDRRISLAIHWGTYYFGNSKKDEFNLLCTFPDEEEENKCSEHTVVLVTYRNIFYRPNDETAEAVLSQDSKTSVTSAQLVKPILTFAEEEEKKWRESPCSCDICTTQASTYYDNFPERPAQRPTRIELTVAEYMHLFGLDTPENMRALEEALKLSSCAMDLESYTVSLPVPTGFSRPGYSRKIRADSAPRAVQKIAVIGHADRMRESGEIKLQYIRVRGDTGEAVESACFDYLNYLADRREEAERAKRDLLRPVTRFLEVMKKAHQKFCSENDNEETAENSWRGTIFGRLDRVLERLFRSYVVWSFNGARYDHPMLAGPMSLAARLRSQPGRININKRGNSVVSMSFSGPGLTGIRFRDIRDLLDPSFSLSRFAKMCGLEEEKGIFPFSQLKNDRDLSAKAFDWRPSAWKNDLTGQYTPPEVIEDIKRRFESGEFIDVYDYLIKYLRSDLILLLEGSEKLFDMYRLMMGFHLLDASRFSISSASWYAGQLHLFRNKRPSMFNVQIPSAYAMLRQSTLGGVTVCARTTCDPDDDSPEAGINAHLVLDSSEAATRTFEILDPQRCQDDAHPAVEKVLDSIISSKTSLPSSAAASVDNADLSVGPLIAGATEAADAVETLRHPPQLERLKNTPAEGDDWETVKPRRPQKGKRLVYTDVVGMYAGASKYASHSFSPSRQSQWGGGWPAGRSPAGPERARRAPRARPFLPRRLSSTPREARPGFFHPERGRGGPR